MKSIKWAALTLSVGVLLSGTALAGDVVSLKGNDVDASRIKSALTRGLKFESKAPKGAKTRGIYFGGAKKPKAEVPVVPAVATPTAVAPAAVAPAVTPAVAAPTDEPVEATPVAVQASEPLQAEQPMQSVSEPVEQQVEPMLTDVVDSTDPVEQVQPEREMIAATDTAMPSEEPMIERYECGGGEGAIALSVQFGLNSDALSEESFSLLQEMSKVMTDPALSHCRFSVEGHTDASGDERYNLRLSERRAKSVARYLAQLGVGETQMIVVGKGETDPLNPAQPGAAENRRVQFAITE